MPGQNCSTNVAGDADPEPAAGLHHRPATEGGAGQCIAPRVQGVSGEDGCLDSAGAWDVPHPGGGRPSVPQGAPDEGEQKARLLAHWNELAFFCIGGYLQIK